MKSIYTKEAGFALIVSMIVLAVLSILVVNAVRTTALSENMSGSYMDRARAQQGAEQALRQGENLLLENGETCIAGCVVPVTGTPTSSTTSTAMSAISWVESDARSVPDDSSLPAPKPPPPKYIAKLLPDEALPSAKATEGCKPYSILGKGFGLDSRTAVVLQTVAFICPIT